MHAVRQAKAMFAEMRARLELARVAWAEAWEEGRAMSAPDWRPWVPPQGGRRKRWTRARLRSGWRAVPSESRRQMEPAMKPRPPLSATAQPGAWVGQVRSASGAATKAGKGRETQRQLELDRHRERDRDLDGSLNLYLHLGRLRRLFGSSPSASVFKYFLPLRFATITHTDFPFAVVQNLHFPSSIPLIAASSLMHQAPPVPSAPDDPPTLSMRLSASALSGIMHVI